MFVSCIVGCRFSNYVVVLFAFEAFVITWVDARGVRHWMLDGFCMSVARVLLWLAPCDRRPRVWTQRPRGVRIGPLILSILNHIRRFVSRLRRSDLGVDRRGITVSY